MNCARWGWVGACATGSSHTLSSSPCQDSAGCIEIPEAGALIAAVSDGAGSAELSAVGSRIVVNSFVRHASSYLKSSKAIENVEESLIFEWLDDIRERIYYAAEQRNAKPRDLAATLVAVVVGVDCALIAHIGDGSVALRHFNSTDWTVPSWPSHGEYASTTYFITDDPQPNLRLAIVDGQFSDVAIFTDGLERLALDFSTQSAFAPFLDSKFQLLTSLAPGRHRNLSSALRRYLDSPPILERTDDDKSLILAHRVAP